MGMSGKKVAREILEENINSGAKYTPESIQYCSRTQYDRIVLWFESLTVDLCVLKMYMNERSGLGVPTRF